MRKKQAASPAPRVPTLADVLKCLETSGDLSPVRIRDLRSAISRLCALIGEEPGRIELDLGQLRNRLAAINPVAAHGISQKRLANLRSDLFAAIASSGLKPVKPGTTRSDRALARPEERSSKTRRHRIGLSRLSHYGSAVGLAPVDVNDAVISEFMSWIREGSLHRKPNDLHRQTAVLWNEIARGVSRAQIARGEHPLVSPASQSDRFGFAA